MGFDHPNVVIIAVALNFKTRDDIERKIRKVKFPHFIVGANADPAFDGDVVTGNFEILKFRLVGFSRNNFSLKNGCFA